MADRLGFVWVGLVLVAAAGFALLASQDTPDPVGRGTRAPAFALESLAGGPPVELADLRGKVVLINFWATWCEPCEAEMPAMQRLYRELRDEGFELLAVSVDGDAEPVRAFQRRLALVFPILLDPGQQVAEAYQTFRFPESLLVDQQGVIVERYIGGKEWDASAYLERIRRLLRGAVPSAATQGGA
ncbi:MAG: redoxin domain-containing protein [Deltaproteobacteria bacterium]|nr:redoxin domain-containing protein [Deltaproteobacteria bacterium]MBW2360484.1 redoxin domain-containing protein [Deltaproteobacteria bacterium]